MLHIPYFQTSRYRVSAMLELARVTSGEHVADLGAGDGRIAIAFAEKGAYVTAYEIDPALRATIAELSEKAGVKDKITIAATDFWQADFSAFSIIAIYPMPDIMVDLEKKLKEECRSGTRIVINYYPLPNWIEKTKKDNIYLYETP